MLIFPSSSAMTASGRLMPREGGNLDSGEGNDRRRSYGCEHTRKAVDSDGKAVLRAYQLAIRLALACIPDDQTLSHGSKPFRIKCKHLGCFNCRVVCLSCSYVGCLQHGRKTHALVTGHNLGVELLGDAEALLYCFACEDYIEDDIFEAVRISTIQRFIGGGGVEWKAGGLLGGNESLSGSPSRPGIIPSFQASTGIRGFYNMGATCFMSVILQSLIHNPLVRNFYLSGGHERILCAHNPCLGCCINDVFSEFFSSSSVAGYGPTEILMTAWKLKRSLAGYSEQDAHEFLQFILNELHNSNTNYGHEIGKPPESDNNSDTHCNCISHRTFYGELESNIKCQHCGTITTTVDPMMDLSLEIRGGSGTTSNGYKKHGKKPSKRQSYSLEECLDRFTGSESLDTTYYCKYCQRQRYVDKRLAIRRLPAVLAIQLKRFEHLTSSSKIETHVRFPLQINMAKYTSGNQDTLIYELFGVVCHQGSINTGHYTCMMKSQNGTVSITSHNLHSNTIIYDFINLVALFR